MIITLTSDFGFRDGYVGAMKGAILAANPKANIVDISHDVTPHSVSNAAYVLWTAYRYFPPETVHVCVVDPTVGTDRVPILLESKHGRFVGPDNGVFTYILQDNDGRKKMKNVGDSGLLSPVATKIPNGCAAYALNNPSYWRYEISSTFHGRDLFAPVAAHLSNGVESEVLGDQLDSLMMLDLGLPEIKDSNLIGHVVHIDNFGNLMTDIRHSDIHIERFEISIGESRILGLQTNYAEGDDGPFALISSTGYLEIAVRNGRANEKLASDLGTQVILKPLSG